MFASHFEYIPESIDTYLPCQTRLGLGHYRQERSQIVDGVDIILLYHAGYHLAVGDISLGRRTTLQQLSLGLCALDIASYYMVVAIDFSQFTRQLRTNLACRADDQDIFHVSST